MVERGAEAAVDIRYQREHEALSPNAVRVLSPLLIQDILNARANEEPRDGDEPIDVPFDKDAEMTLTQGDFDKIRSLEEDRTITTSQFDRLREAILHDLETQTPKGEPKERHYHVPQHTLKVYAATEKLLKLLERRIRIPESDRQVVLLAAMCHDLRHYGRTIRQDYTDDGFSNEEIAAMVGDHFMRDAGFSLRQRLMFQGLIIGSTFGNNEIAPQTELEKLLAIADLAAGAFDENFEDFIRNTKLVNFEEREPGDRNENYQELFHELSRFMKFLKMRMTPEAEILYGEILQRRSCIISALRVLVTPEGTARGPLTPEAAIALEAATRRQLGTFLFRGDNQATS